MSDESGDRGLHTGLTVLDHETLMEAASGDRIEAAALIRLFLELSAEQLDRIRRALHGGDLPEVARVAHQLAGGAAACGFRSLAEASRTLERAAGASGDDAPKQFENLLNQWALAHDAAWSLLRGPSP